MVVSYGLSTSLERLLPVHRRLSTGLLSMLDGWPAWRKRNRSMMTFRFPQQKPRLHSNPEWLRGPKLVQRHHHHNHRSSNS